MDKSTEYVRVGTQLYKIVHVPTLHGGEEEQLMPWKYGTLKQDFAKDEMPQIPKYDGFCTIPSHTDYQAVVSNFLNLYKPISHEPAEGDFSHIVSLLRHIFGEQYELGVDYLQLLYLNPMQKLPILLLVSEERNTGKTTFLNFLKAVFQENATFNTNEDFRSQFNADWAGKLLIVVDEVLLSRREDSERLKNLSTAKTYKVEAKGKDRQEVQFFAKFVLCSNNELYPVIIDQEETRYWVRKVTRLESDDTFFLEKLKAEIPAFLFYLKQRPMSSTQQSRMWFSPKDIHTDALDRIIQNNRPCLEVDMAEVILDIMDKMNVDSVQFCLEDLMALLTYAQVKAEKSQVRKILKDYWKLSPAPNALTYTTYVNDFSFTSGYGARTKVGRFFSVTRDTIRHLCP